MTLGLPDGVRACLFDLDGVLTQTAGCVVGIDRNRQSNALREHGASVVVCDLAEFLEPA